MLSMLSTQEKAEADAAEAAAAATTAREREAERILKEMRSFEVRVETTRHSLATSKARTFASFMTYDTPSLAHVRTVA